MIDIHSHILPGVDDGAQTLEESLLMARQAAEQGISMIVATPHYNGIYKNNKENILPGVDQLNNHLKMAGIPLHVVPGQECRIYGDMIEGFQKGELLTINDGWKYMLIEFSYRSVPMYAEQLLYNMQCEGIMPIIVHPERNQKLISDPDLIYKFVEKGILMQVTAASIAGVFGRKIQKFCLKMLEANLVHFIASDAHNVTTRDFKMKEAYELIERKFGSQYVANLKENAKCIVDGDFITPSIPKPFKRKRFLGFF